MLVDDEVALAGVVAATSSEARPGGGRIRLDLRAAKGL